MRRLADHFRYWHFFRPVSFLAIGADQHVETPGQECSTVQALSEILIKMQHQEKFLSSPTSSCILHTDASVPWRCVCIFVGEACLSLQVNLRITQYRHCRKVSITC